MSNQIEDSINGITVPGGDASNNAPEITYDRPGSGIAIGSTGFDADEADLFRIVSDTSGDLSFFLTGLSDDLDLVLFDANGEMLTSSIQSGAESESFTYEVTAGETYFLLVSPWEDAESDYSLTVAESVGEPGMNDVINGITVPGGDAGDIAPEISYDGLEGGIVTGSTGFGADQSDTFRIVSDTSGDLSFFLAGLSDDLDLVLGDVNGEVLTSSIQSGPESESFTYGVTAGETYLLWVSPWEDAESEYTLTIAGSGDEPGVNDVINGITVPGGDAGDIAPEISYSGPEGGIVTGSTGFGADQSDTFRIVTDTSGDLSFFLNGLSDDLDLVLTDSLGESLATSFNIGTASESITYPVTAGESYLLWVSPWEGAASAYTLNVEGPTGASGGGSTAAVDVINGVAVPGGDVGVNAPEIQYGGSEAGIVTGSTGFGADESDLFRVVPTNSGELSILLTGLSDDLDLVLGDATGEALTVSTNVGATDEYISYQVTGGETYYLLVTPWDGARSDYRLEVNGSPTGLDDFGDSATTAGIVNVGSVVEGIIDPSQDQDWFAVELIQGRSYQVDLEGSSTSAGTLPDPVFFGVFDSGENFIPGSLDDDGGELLNSRIVFSAQETGTYFLAVGAYAGSIGSYQLRIVDIDSVVDDYGNTTSTAGLITPGKVALGEIETTQDTDWFAVELKGGRTYRIDLEGSSTAAGTLPDPTFAGIYDANGMLIANTDNDDGGEQLNSRTVFTAPSSGTYYLAAGAFAQSTGSYALRIVDVEASVDDYGNTSSTAAVVEIGEIAKGEIESAEDRDWFSVDLEGGRTYRIDLEGRSTSAGTLPDPLFYGIYDAAGELIAGTLDDDGGESMNSRLEFTVPESGTYFLEAGAYELGIGTYTLTVADVSSTISTSGFNILIDFDGDLDYLQFFETALLRWTQVITGDLTDVIHPSTGTLVDDIVISASVVAIDGLGGTLGYAGPELFRQEDALPYQGAMFFDVADLEDLEKQGILIDTILHEMGHVLGFNPYTFNQLGLIDGFFFTGTQAVTVYADLVSDPDVAGVPLEDGGGAGTALGHWEEDIFGNELMTGYTDSPPMPLSLLTIAAFADLGYQVDLASADDYTLEGSSGLTAPLTSRSTITSSNTANINMEGLVNALTEELQGSVYTHGDISNLNLTVTYTPKELSGAIVSADENTIYFVDSFTDGGRLVRFTGSFQKNSPRDLLDVKGAVNEIAFLTGNFAVVTTLQYENPQSVERVVSDWRQDFLDGENRIQVVSIHPTDDTVEPGDGDDFVDLGRGNDIFIDGPGNDSYIGGMGIDAVVYSGQSEVFTVNPGDSEFTVVDLTGLHGRDLLVSVERVLFDDLALAFDLNGNAGDVVKLLGVLLGGNEWYNRELIGIGLDLLDNSGLSFTEIAELGLQAVLGPEPDNEAFISLLYSNLVGVEPDEGILNALVDLVENDTYSKLDLTLAAIEHPLNYEIIGLNTLAVTGVEYFVV
ncbi:MAG: pre-peptidase C-terminal domain-containing protein [Gammaproteobacteria bacterium]|nr:pre-peptidase C-terminal domain-containing protein [Pseudomonadales bacterium]MCP5346131.1 pre-peptidase C-terminal domain-containing protein [Pseudomonadales bacterium]